MKLEKTLYQRSHIYFAVFFLFVLTGFWLTYFSKILDQENYRMHFHGITLIIWCLMLISQAYLIRSKNTALHTSIGKFSYLLVPLIAYTTIDLFKYRLSELSALVTRDYLFIASVLNALFAFLIFYGLAMYNRKRPAVHARYMVCTVIPMFTAIFDRIITNYFPNLLPHFPSVDGPVVQVVGLVLGDLLLAGLCIWDWQTHRRFNVFPAALMIHLLYHYSVMNFYKFDFWKAFGNWFFAL